MRPDTTYLRALNAEYRMWTGEGLYLSVSQTTPDQTVYSFVSGSIVDLTGAEGYLRWALEAIVCQHLTVARVAEGLAVSWNTANNAVLAEGKSLTRDLGGSATTQQFADAVIAKLG